MSNEAFEKWAIDYGLDYESSFTRDDVETSWQAAKADSEQEIAELKSNINDLREWLGYLGHECKRHGITVTVKGKSFTEALASTPAQSLQAHDNEVIEKCAKVCDESYAFDSDGFAKEIRALKGKQNESALDVMAENARELGLVYCKHGSDSYCKECYMEKIK